MHLKYGFISVDDHVQEVPNLWSDRLKKKFADRVVTDILIDDRKDLNGRLKGNVLEVEYALGKSLQTGGLT